MQKVYLLNGWDIDRSAEHKGCIETIHPGLRPRGVVEIQAEFPRRLERIGLQTFMDGLKAVPFKPEGRSP